MVNAMKHQFSIIAFTALFAAFDILAWQTPVGPAPAPAFADMERSTNVQIQAESLQRCRVFECSLSLLASPSNALEVAFGKSRNGEEALLPGDETFAIGWEAGAWFVASATSRICSVQQEGVARRSLSFTLHVSEGGVPRTLSLSADCTNNAFSAIIDSPPDWMFSREWDAIRLTVRGAYDSVESASVRFGPNPAFIILR
ncbi:MAG: hypothetical protein IJQ73_17775 [Kiritimatiellae bacterium]|nr:hypothetical protein [Kiritimatiellia bacterium]